MALVYRVGNQIKTYLYLIKSFLVIGSVSFGGYMPLIAMVRDRLVMRDKMLDEVKITEALALGSLLPGPLAVNVVAYVSFAIAGMFGALLSVIAVLLPSFLVVLILSILFFKYDSVFDFDFLMMGVIPVVLAIIFSMGLAMFKNNCKGLIDRIIALASLILLLLLPGYWTIVLVIIISGLLGIAFEREPHKEKEPEKSQFEFKLGYLVIVPLLLFTYTVARSHRRDHLNFILFDEFAKSSLTLFGGGYVMIPIFKTLLVDTLKWATENEFLIGISLGQITPGPILTSSVFFGFKVNGIPGALVSAAGIFLPSSCLMILCSKFYSQVSSSLVLASALKGIKSAIVGLILYSGVSLIQSNTLFPNVAYLVGITGVAFFVTEFFRINPAWAVSAGALVGVLVQLIIDIL
jgi:chromate transporter